MQVKYLTKEEIESLPISSMLDLTDGQTAHTNGLIYDADGKVFARKESFRFVDDAEYQDTISPMPDSRPPENYLEEKVGESENSNPQPILWSEFNKIPFPENQWTIKNLVPSGGFVFLAAPSGEKKTWIAMEMAKAIASGKAFLNEFEVEKGPVLYLNGEMAQSEVQRRGRLLELYDTGNIWLLNKELDFYDDASNIAWLFGFIQIQKIKVVILDTFRAFAGGMEEGKAELIRQFFNNLKPLKDQGVSVIILDHTRKPNRFEGQAPKKEQLFASQDKVASVEILLMLKSNPGSDDVFIYQLKNRLGREIEPFQILVEDQMNEQGQKERVIIVYKGEFTAEEYKQEQAEEIILSALADGGKTTKELIEIVMEEKIGKRNGHDAIRALMNKGKIEMPYKQGRQNYYILPSNEEILAID